MEPVKIEFFHDVICSFCFPMSFRMRKLQELMPDVEIIHRSFALVKKEQDFTIMFGSRESAKNEILTHWVHANRNDDLHRFNINGMRDEKFLFPISMKPLWACKAAGFTAGNEGYWDLFDALQAAFFMNHKNIELDKVIFDQVKLVNLDFNQWLEYFNSDEVKLSVEEDFKIAEQYGLQAIPALVINGSTIINGAVSLNQIKQTFEAIKNDKSTTLSANGACGLNGCF